MTDFENDPGNRGEQEDFLYHEYSNVLIGLRHATGYFAEEGGHAFDTLEAMQAGIYSGGPDGLVDLTSKLREYGSDMFSTDENSAFMRGRLKLIHAKAEESSDDKILATFIPVDQHKLLTHVIAPDHTKIDHSHHEEMPIETLMTYFNSSLTSDQ